MVKRAWYDWDISTTYDHVAVAVELDIAEYVQNGMTLLSPPRFKLEVAADTSQDFRQELWQWVWAKYASDFDKKIDEQDINGADGIWAGATVEYLEQLTQDEGYDNGGVVRGGPPNFVRCEGVYKGRDDQELVVPPEAAAA